MPLRYFNRVFGPTKNWQGVTKMALLKYIKRLISKKREPKQKLTYVHDAPYETKSVDCSQTVPAVENMPDHEIDLSPQRDLEDYAQDLTVSKEAIEQWISAGLLMPGELEVAKKIVKIKQRKEQSGPQ
jgi:hypothetical protein